jgi:hypothetical protein
MSDCAPDWGHTPFFSCPREPGHYLPLVRPRLHRAGPREGGMQPAPRAPTDRPIDRLFRFSAPSALPAPPREPSLRHPLPHAADITPRRKASCRKPTLSHLFAKSYSGFPHPEKSKKIAKSQRKSTELAESAPELAETTPELNGTRPNLGEPRPSSRTPRVTAPPSAYPRLIVFVRRAAHVLSGSIVAAFPVSWSRPADATLSVDADEPCRPRRRRQ